MKTNHLLRKFVIVAISLAMIFVAKAQTHSTALSLTDLQLQFRAANAAGVRDTINIGAKIAVNFDLSLVSTGDTIIINMVPYGISVTAGTLTIGNKVKITSAYANAGAIQAASGGNVVINAGSYIAATTGNTVQALAGGTVTVNGGYISSTATSPVVSAGGSVTVNGGRIISSNYPAIASGMSISSVATGGTVTINGGYVATTSGGISRGIVVDYNGVCIVNGGEVRSDMGGGRGISINGTNAGGKLYVNGGTISAIGATGRAIQLDNNNSMLWVTGSPTITGGLEAIMVQKTGFVLISGTPIITGVIGTNTTTARLYDARGLSAIVATPGTGYYTSSQTVTLTGGTGTVNKYTGTSSVTGGVYSGAGVTPTTVSSILIYTTDGTTPVATSAAAYSAPVTVAVPSVLNVAPLIEGTIVGNPAVFTYSLTGRPVTAAPTPPAYTTAKEISIFSDAFTNVANTNFFPGWGQATASSIVQIAGNNTLKYANLNYQGMELGSDVNAVPMKYLHLDVWTSDETSLKIYPISRSTGDTRFYTASTLALNSWNSIDIPLSYFTGLGLNVSDIFQFKFVGTNGKTVYIDNLYFYDNTTTVDTQAPTAFTASKGAVTDTSIELLLNATDDSGAVNFVITYGTKTLTTGGVSGVQKTYKVIGLTGSTDYLFSVVAKDLTGNTAANSPIVVAATTATPLPVPTVSAPTPTVAAAKVMSVYSNAYAPVKGSINYNPNWSQTTLVTTFNVGTDATMKYENFNYQGIDLGGVIDVTAMTKLHVDVFTPNETSISIQPISTPSGTKVALTPLKLNQWNSFDIPLSSFTGLNKAGVFQVMFNDGTKKISYIDNIYFYNDLGTSLSNINGTTAIKCYPSQVVSNITVSADIEINLVTVRNLLGQSIKSVVVNSTEKSIDLSAVSAGNYFVTVKLANGQSATQKIIKL